MPDPAEVTSEPFRPSQRQTEVTEKLTGVRLDLELCGVCSQTRGVGDHHIIFRSRGGTKGPTIPVCVSCHDAVHHNDWRLTIVKDGLQIKDRDGDVVWRLKKWPYEGDAGQFVQLLDRVGDVEKLMPDIAASLLPWQAVQVFEALRMVSEGGWRAQMRLIGEFYHYRLPSRTPPEKVLALCQLFGIRRSQLYNHLQVVQAFGDSPVVDETNLSMGYLIEAARSEDPGRWLEFAQERKLTYPSFSRDDLRHEIVRAGARKSQPTDEPPATPPVVRIWGRCPECKHIGWIEKLPVGSTGEPTKLDE